jgi:hypothetical protein
MHSQGGHSVMLAFFCGLGALGAWIKHSRATAATDEASSRNRARSSSAGSDDEDNDTPAPPAPPAESASAPTLPPSIHLVERALRTHLRYFSPVNIALCALIAALALWLGDKEPGVLAAVGLVVAAASARTVSNALTLVSLKSLK